MIVNQTPIDQKETKKNQKSVFYSTTNESTFLEIKFTNCLFIVNTYYNDLK